MNWLNILCLLFIGAVFYGAFSYIYWRFTFWLERRSFDQVFDRNEFNRQKRMENDIT